MDERGVGTIAALGRARRSGALSSAELVERALPVAVKDMIATREAPTRAQSRVPGAGLPAGRDAPVVHRIHAGGGIVLGKTSTTELSCGLPDPAEIAALLTAALLTAALLTAARLPAGPADIAAAVRAYPALCAACDALFDVADDDGQQPW